MSLSRLTGLLFGLSVVAGLGCPAPGPEDTDPRAAKLEFAGLPASVDCAATPDADPAPGFQIVVDIQLSSDARGDDGFTTVEVASSRGDLPAGEGTFNDARRATVIVSVIADEDAPGAENTLTATAIGAAGEVVTASETLRIICADDAPPPVCVFTAPQQGAELTVEPLIVGVACTGGDPDDAAEQSLLKAGTVVVTATPGNGAPPESVEIELTAGAGAGALDLPDADTATLDLLLADPAGLFEDAVTDAIDVTLDLGFTATSIAVVVAGVPVAGDGDALNIADMGGAASAAPITSELRVTLDEDVTGGAFSATTALGDCTTDAPVSGTTVTLVGCPLPQGVSQIVVAGQKASGALLIAGATLTIEVDTTRPTVAFTTPSDGQLLTSADDDGVGAGFSTAVVLASADEGATVTLSDDGGAPVAVTVGANGASASLPLGQGARTLTAAITDRAGNAGADATVAVTVDSEAPTLVLVAGDVTGGDDIGGDPSDGIQVDVTVTPTGLSAGRTITITSDVGGDIGTCLSAGDDVAVQCRVTYAVGQTHSVTASATDEAGNAGISNAQPVSS